MDRVAGFSAAMGNIQFTLVRGYEYRRALVSGSLVVVSNIDKLLVIHQAKANAVEPTAAPEYIPLDPGVGKEVDRRHGLGAENLDRDFMSVGFKPAICRRVCLTNPFLDAQAEGFSVRALEQTIAGARVDLASSSIIFPSFFRTAGTVMPSRRESYLWRSEKRSS